MRLPVDLEREILARATTNVGVAGEALGPAPAPKRANKYGAIPTTVDGIRFASKKEARRYGQLKILLEAGAITDLELQPRFPLTMEGKTFGAYVGDFRYKEAGQVVVEDVKSAATRRNAVYRLKRKIVAIQYGIEIKEV